MRYWLAGILALVTAGIAVVAPASAGIDKVYRKPAEEKSSGELLADFVGYQGFSKSYALVIGISKFNAYSTLPTEKDPIRMRDFLIDEAGFDYVHVLTDDKATKTRIDELMVDVLPAMMDENDQFLFYWSGHGDQRENALRGYVGYLPLASSLKDRYSTMISMDDVQRWDALLKPQQVLFLLDACFSGLAGSTPKSNPRELTIEQLAKPAHHLLTAGTGEEQTIASDRWGGSIFTEAVLRAIRGEADAETSYDRDGVVSFSELIGYVKTRVANEAPAAGWTESITPQPRDLRTSTGEFFFLTNERKLAKLKSTGAQYQGRFEHGMPVVAMGAAPPPPTCDREGDRLFWEAIKNETAPGYFEAYLKRVASGELCGLFADIARLKLEAQGEPKLAALPAARQKPEAANPVQPAVGIYQVKPGDEFRDCEDCPLMVVVPAGSFTMGSTEAERTWALGQQGVQQEWVDREMPQHPVEIERPLAVGKYEVTVGQFEAFVQATDHEMSDGCLVITVNEVKENVPNAWRSPGFEQSANHPVVCVSWGDAKSYIEWLSEKTGHRYRLLSEAEWEYAARGETTTMRPWGDDSDNNAGRAYANGMDLAYTNESGGDPKLDCSDGQVYTASVGSYSANAFGLHDVIGNVFEWVEDCWNESYEAPGRPNDGSVWTSGDCDLRVIRGGSWSNLPELLRSATRGSNITNSRFNQFGFRVARTLAHSESVIR